MQKLKNGSKRHSLEPYRNKNDALIINSQNRAYMVPAAHPDIGNQSSHLPPAAHDAEAEYELKIGGRHVV